MQVFRLLCSAAPDTLCELLTVCAIYSVSRAELIRFVCCIDNVQQSFRIRVNIVTIAGEAEGLHHLIGRNTCYICAQACFRPLANSSNITFFGISGKARSKVEYAVPLAPSSTIDNARDILAGDKKIFVTDVSFRSSL